MAGISETVEMRAEGRQRLMISALVRRYGGAGETLAVCLVDRSAGGLSFSSSVGLEMGERVQIAFALDAGTYSGRMEVVHCAAIDEETFRVGLKVVA